MRTGLFADCKRASCGLSRHVRSQIQYQSRLRVEPLEDRWLLSVGAGEIELFSTAPATFIANEGQWADASVRYAFLGDGANVLHTDTGPVIQLFKREELTGPVTDDAPMDATRGGGDLLDAVSVAGDMENTPTQSISLGVTFDGATAVEPVGLDLSETLYNFFLGEKSCWQSRVSSYTSIAYPGLYDGIDLLTYGQWSSLKYEFHVAPGTDYRQIQISYSCSNGLSIDEAGRLHVATEFGDLVDDAPYVYQVIDGYQVEVAASFQLVDIDTYTFMTTGEYDPLQELIIDPTISWSTLIGESDTDYGTAISIDTSGNLCVVGTTGSADIEKANNSHFGYLDAFAAGVSASGTVAWATYLGGGGIDYGNAVATDTSGNVYVTGTTGSTDLSGAVNGAVGGAFVAKLDASGILLWAKYLGGSGRDCGNDIAIDSEGNVFVTGTTSSSDFNGAVNSIHGDYDDAFVAKIDVMGTLAWAVYLGGSDDDIFGGGDSGIGIAVDVAGDAYITGSTNSTDFEGATNNPHESYFFLNDAFVAKVSSSGVLVWATYVGGSDEDEGKSIALDESGTAFVTGITRSTDFEGANNSTCGYFDAFVAEVSAAGAVKWARYLGGSVWDQGNGVFVNASNDALYVTGQTYSTDFDGASNSSRGWYDAFVAEISSSGAMINMTYLGGSSNDYGNCIVLDGEGNAFVTGATYSTDFEGATNSNHGDQDAFVIKITGVATVQTAMERQVKRISELTFDGTGDDLTVTVAGLTSGQTIDLWVGQTASEPHFIGTFTFTPGDSPWTFATYSIDISSAGISCAQYAIVTSTQPLTILSAVALHPDISDWVGYVSYPSTATSLPVLPVEDYTSVATLYRWDWDKKDFVSLGVTDWTTTIDWNKKTVMLTHGWNSSLNNAEFIPDFAEDFMDEDGRSLDQCKAHNILAVDWYDNGSTLGSDPNRNSDLSDVVNLVDAWQSSKNGISAGEALANRLTAVVGDALKPENMMLIGHSNGAGFMASMALTWLKAGKGVVAEVDALDAPTATAAWQRVYDAAAEGIHVCNYYMLSTQYLIFGSAIHVPGKDRVLNFGMDYSASLLDAITHGLIRNCAKDSIPHSLVALCYAETADNAHPLISWGFRESAFVDGNSCFDYCQFWEETDVPGYFVVSTNELLVDVVQSTQTYWDSITNGARSIWSTGLLTASGLTGMLKGINTTLRASDDYVTIYAKAHSAVLASIDVTIPDDADLLEFTLSVSDSGNNDYLLVAIGDDVLEQVNLANVQTAGGLKSQLWMKEHAGESTTITFYMPSKESSTAEFLISDIQFLEVDLPPEAVYDSSSVAISNSTIAFSVTYTDSDGTVVESTIDDSDIIVTGPNGYSQYAVRVGTETSNNGSSVTATYEVTSPGTVWTASDSGTYRIEMQPNEVSDSDGRFVASGTVGMFVVSLLPEAAVDVTLVRSPSSFDDSGVGERIVLPQSVDWIDEWDTYWVEVWVSTPNGDGVGVACAQLDLTYDTDCFSPTQIEYGPAFTQSQTGAIDDSTGVIRDLGAATLSSNIGDDRYALLARVKFESTMGDPGTPLNANGCYVRPLANNGLGLNGVEAALVGQSMAQAAVADLPNTELWPVMYDLDDDGDIGLGDLSYFAAAYSHVVGEAGVGYTWASDFDRDGEIGPGDLSYFAAAYHHEHTDPGTMPYPFDFPAAWHQEAEGAALGAQLPVVAHAAPAGASVETSMPTAAISAHDEAISGLVSQEEQAAATFSEVEGNVSSSDEMNAACDAVFTTEYGPRQSEPSAVYRESLAWSYTLARRNQQSRENDRLRSPVLAAELLLIDGP